jgi:hypothetical protein
MPPSTPVAARVVAVLCNYYNYDFAESNFRYQSLELRTGDGTLPHGYVQRNTPWFHKIMNIICDGNAHSITLEIRHVGSQTDMPLITNLLSPTWLYFPQNAT